MWWKTHRQHSPLNPQNCLTVCTAKMLQLLLCECWVVLQHTLCNDRRILWHHLASTRSFRERGFSTFVRHVPKHAKSLQTITLTDMSCADCVPSPFPVVSVHVDRTCFTEVTAWVFFIAGWATVHRRHSGMATNHSASHKV